MLCLFIGDLRWFNIQNLEEACKLLQYGNKNRSAAATKMNHSSSRRQINPSIATLNVTLVFLKLIPASFFFFAAIAFLP